MAGDIFTKEALFALVKETTEITRGCDLGQREGVRDLSEKSAADYAKIGASRLDLDSDDFGQMMEGVTRQSWSKVRAALLYEAERTCIEQRRLCDVLQRAWRSEKDEAAKAEAFDLATQAALKANRAAKAFVQIQNSEKPAERSKPKASKKKSLPDVKPKDKDWRLHLFQSVDPIYWPSLCALWVGARPAEIEKGVKFTYQKDDDGRFYVNILIPGAKLSENSGQKWRQICIDRVNTDLTFAIKAVMNELNSTSFVAKRPAQRLNKDFRKFKEWGFIEKDISPYSMRHAFTSDLKAEKWHPEQIAAALGHASARSQQHYGYVQKGRTGGLGIVGVEAEREIRTEWNKGVFNKVEYDYDSPSM